ncbi:radical SAM family heme chaperone HemW [Xinfangfangia sp. CPCC 101601]|uniref:Heme chaperone HemW n=1 Tax=Pseudogemmobacter lacusdianii TaxID=3069608 RepID=A0ABU0VW58_9RHOB|nr:radical SAM family heme chaperone HemW [Xinfangfangia sp. CPCC 101601]MDQ2065175.1 radical SAM family heme chaperone HemW [Xinfangfangia sp. CPCC 101601]
MKLQDWQQGGFGVYVHWPFCKAKCPYCDFNSHVRQSVDQSAWAEAFLSEIDRTAAETGPRAVQSVFFGGGTPSLMDPALVGAILDRIASRWSMANDAEITLEANPTSVEAERFLGYRDAGVNRLSLGIQALNDEDLRRLGRQHSSTEALAALSLARETFARVSCDLIYARQDQTLDGWKAELRQLLALGPDHMSLYQLTIEDGTAFKRLFDEGKLRGLPDEDLAAEMYEVTEDLCREAGLLAYEVSNYAKPGSESRHNLIYWRMGDYAGIGPGAHGRLTLPNGRFGTSTLRAPEAWLGAAQNGNGELEREVLTDEDRAVEYLMMSMRLSEGSDMTRFAALRGMPLPETRVNALINDGFLTKSGDQLIATPAGRLVLNRLLLELCA